MQIDILLATYNAGHYINTQIQSIIGQTISNWRLLIHDDGSTDNTIEIIKKIAINDSRIYLIEDNINHLGPGKNFMHLLQYSTAPYICFCDQDDMWFENKLEIQLKAISQKDNSKPQVIFFNAYKWVFEKENNQIENKINICWNSLKQVLFLNGGMQGAAAIFNQKMLNFINRSYQTIAMHDHILTLAGIICGGIDFIDKAIFLYRRHNSNVTQITNRKKIDQIKSALSNKYTVVQKEYYNATSDFYNIFIKDINKNEKRIINLYLSYPNKNWIIRYYSILFNGFSLGNSKVKLLTKILLRKYID